MWYEPLTLVLLACADAYAEASSIVSESLGSVRTVLAFNAAERTAEEYDGVSLRWPENCSLVYKMLPASCSVMLGLQVLSVMCVCLQWLWHNATFSGILRSALTHV